MTVVGTSPSKTLSLSLLSPFYSTHNQKTNAQCFKILTNPSLSSPSPRTQAISCQWTTISLTPTPRTKPTLRLLPTYDYQNVTTRQSWLCSFFERFGNANTLIRFIFPKQDCYISVSDYTNEIAQSQMAMLNEQIRASRTKFQRPLSQILHRAVGSSTDAKPLHPSTANFDHPLTLSPYLVNKYGTGTSSALRHPINVSVQ